MKTKEVFNIDRIVNPYDYRNYSGVMEETFKITEGGYLNGRAVVTTIGVFPYLQKDGSIIYELRAPEEVFDPESLETLKMIPITNNHPVEKVTQDNIDKLQKGTTGNSVEHDAYSVSIPISIKDKEAVQDVKDKKRALSCGYRTVLVFDSGVWNGIKYDARQTNIRYNHIAIVEKGRAGDAAVMKIDHAINNDDMVVLNINRKGDLKMSENLIKIKLDGVDFTAEKEVVQAYNKLSTKLDFMEKEKEDFKVKISRLEAERDAKNDEIETLKTNKKNENNDDVVNALVNEKIMLVRAAEKLNVEFSMADSHEDIMKKIILHKKPDISLDKKDINYLKAYFDAIVDAVEIKNDGNQRVVGGANTTQKDDAHEKYIQTLTNKWKGENK